MLAPLLQTVPAAPPSALVGGLPAAPPAPSLLNRFVNSVKGFMKPWAMKGVLGSAVVVLVLGGIAVGLTFSSVVPVVPIVLMSLAGAFLFSQCVFAGIAVYKGWA